MGSLFIQLPFETAHLGHLGAESLAILALKASAGFRAAGAEIGGANRRCPAAVATREPEGATARGVGVLADGQAAKAAA